MKKLFFFTIALLWTGFSSFSKTLSLQGEFINSSHRYIQYIGRISHKGSGCYSFQLSRSSNTGFIPGYISKNVCQAHEWIFYGKDRQCCPFKISFNSPSDSIVTLATALNDTVHTVAIMNVIEAFHRQPEFKGFLLDKGKTWYPRQTFHNAK